MAKVLLPIFTLITMIDSHCHLTDPKFSDDLPAVLTRAREGGVEKLITIADSIAESQKALSLAEKNEQIFCSIGVHPHNAKDWSSSDLAVLTSLISHPKVRAIGEIGLDYHYDFSPREIQREVFRAQLKFAADHEMPVVVHCREAITDVTALLQELTPSKIVLHCCTELWEDVRPLVERGVVLGFTGIATFPDSEKIRHTIVECPLSQMMIETDAPYLAPVPLRGKRCEPLYVKEVAALVARLKGVSVEEVDRETTKNTVAFYGLPS